MVIHATESIFGFVIVDNILSDTNVAFKNNVALFIVHGRVQFSAQLAHSNRIRQQNVKD